MSDKPIYVYDIELSDCPNYLLATKIANMARLARYYSSDDLERYRNALDVELASRA